MDEKWEERYSILASQYNQLNAANLSLQERNNDLSNVLYDISQEICKVVFDKDIPIEIKIKLRDAVKKGHEFRKREEQKILQSTTSTN